MPKQKIIYDSPLDAIVALAKRLSVYEERHRLSSEAFFDKYKKGLLDDSIDFVEWSNDYQNFLALKLELEERLMHAA
ncbi:MAG: antitoxin TumA [bacterium]